MNEKITTENCLELSKQFEQANRAGEEFYLESVYQQSGAWMTVNNFCRQNGMEMLPAPCSGIKDIITFISSLLPSTEGKCVKN